MVAENYATFNYRGFPYKRNNLCKISYVIMFTYTLLYPHMQGRVECLKTQFLDFKILNLKSRKNTKCEPDPRAFDDTLLANASL